MMKHNSLSFDADGIAILALSYLAGDAELLGPFLDTTGLSPVNIRDAARNPRFLAAIGEYLLADEALLKQFALSQNLSPESVARACLKLSGATPG